MVCPKCGAPIKWYDLAPNCKQCGVHILYYTQEQDLARDAKKTELEFARARVITAKLKNAFIAGKLPIARMVIMVLCIGTLCIPFGGVTLSLPFWQQEISVGAIGIYKLVTDGLLPQLLNFLQAGLAETEAKFTFAALVLFVLTVLVAFCGFLSWLLSFIKLRRGCRACCGLIAAATVLDVATVGMLLLVKSNAGVN